MCIHCACVSAHTRTRVPVYVRIHAACKVGTNLHVRTRAAFYPLIVQESVEGLSVVAITYYSTGVLGYLAKAADAMGWLPLPVEVTLGACVPLLGVSVYLGLHRLKANVVGGKGGRGH